LSPGFKRKSIAKPNIDLNIELKNLDKEIDENENLNDFNKMKIEDENENEETNLNKEENFEDFKPLIKNNDKFKVLFNEIEKHNEKDNCDYKNDYLNTRDLIKTSDLVDEEIEVPFITSQKNKKSKKHSNESKDKCKTNFTSQNNLYEFSESNFKFLEREKENDFSTKDITITNNITNNLTKSKVKFKPLNNDKKESKDNSEKRKISKIWTAHQDYMLICLSKSKVANKWKVISKIIGSKTPSQCIYRLKQLSLKQQTDIISNNFFEEKREEAIPDTIVFNHFHEIERQNSKNSRNSRSLDKNSEKNNEDNTELLSKLNDFQKKISNKSYSCSKKDSSSCTSYLNFPKEENSLGDSIFTKKSKKSSKIVKFNLSKNCLSEYPPSNDKESSQNPCCQLKQLNFENEKNYKTNLLTIDENKDEQNFTDIILDTSSKLNQFNSGNININIDANTNNLFASNNILNFSNNNSKSLSKFNQNSSGFSRLNSIESNSLNFLRLNNKSQENTFLFLNNSHDNINLVGESSFLQEDFYHPTKFPEDSNIYISRKRDFDLDNLLDKNMFIDDGKSKTQNINFFKNDTIPLGSNTQNIFNDRSKLANLQNDTSNLLITNNLEFDDISMINHMNISNNLSNNPTNNLDILENGNQTINKSNKPNDNEDEKMNKTYFSDDNKIISEINLDPLNGKNNNNINNMSKENYRQFNKDNKSNIANKSTNQKDMDEEFNQEMAEIEQILESEYFTLMPFTKQAEVLNRVIMDLNFHNNNLNKENSFIAVNNMKVQSKILEILIKITQMQIKIKETMKNEYDDEYDSEDEGEGTNNK